MFAKHFVSVGESFFSSSRFSILMTKGILPFSLKILPHAVKGSWNIRKASLKFVLNSGICVFEFHLRIVHSSNNRNKQPTCNF